MKSIEETILHNVLHAVLDTNGNDITKFIFLETLFIIGFALYDTK